MLYREHTSVWPHSRLNFGCKCQLWPMVLVLQIYYDHGIMLQLRGYWGRRAPARAGAIFGQEYLPVAIETDSLGPNISTLFKRVCRNREGELFDKVLELLYGYRDGRRYTTSADRVWRARLVMGIVTAREKRPSTSVSVVYRCGKNMGTGFSSLADRGQLSTLSCIIMCIIEHKLNQTKPNQNPRSQTKPKSKEPALC